MKFFIHGLRKTVEGKVLKEGFSPKSLLNLAGEHDDKDVILLYDIPLAVSYEQEQWVKAKEVLAEMGWGAFFRGFYHYDWGAIVISKMRLSHVSVIRFNPNDNEDFDFMAPEDRTALTFNFYDYTKDDIVLAALTFFQARPGQNSALRGETINEIIKTVNEDVTHLLCGNLIENTEETELFKEYLQPLGYRSALNDGIEDAVFARNCRVSHASAKALEPNSTNPPITVWVNGD